MTKRPVLRPPGAVPEAEFLAKCNRCQRCVQICPTNVIFPVKLTADFLTANTPEVIFNRSYCNSCMKCTHICPAGALIPTGKDAMKIGDAVIIKEDCVAWNWTGCTVCMDKCPLKAIELDAAKRPIVDTQKCDGCGICEQLCPSQSLRSNVRGRGILIYPAGTEYEPR
jgi:ferredoxin-type protein NapG